MSGPNEPVPPGDGEDLNDDQDFELPEEDEDQDQEPEAAEAELEESEPPPRQTRRQRQEENWRQRAREAEIERDTLRNIYSQQPQRQTQPDPQQQQQQRAQEYQRISMLPPEEQVAAIDRMIEQRTALATFQSFDRADRSDFERIKSTYPAASRLAQQVENVLQQQRNAGVYQFSREQIYHYLLGQEVHTKSVNGAARQRANGQRNVARQTTRPARPRGDVGTSGNRTRGDDADRRLLESKRIDEL